MTGELFANDSANRNQFFESVESVNAKICVIKCDLILYRLEDAMKKTKNTGPLIEAVKSEIEQVVQQLQHEQGEIRDQYNRHADSIGASIPSDARDSRSFCS